MRNPVINNWNLVKILPIFFSKIIPSFYTKTHSIWEYPFLHFFTYLFSAKILVFPYFWVENRLLYFLSLICWFLIIGVVEYILCLMTIQNSSSMNCYFLYWANRLFYLISIFLWIICYSLIDLKVIYMFGCQPVVNHTHKWGLVLRNWLHLWSCLAQKF